METILEVGVEGKTYWLEYVNKIMNVTGCPSFRAMMKLTKDRETLRTNTNNVNHKRERERESVSDIYTKGCVQSVKTNVL